MSLPILLGWGLPISLVSWFATPLFAPIFSLFLLCSTVIFFSYFLYLPTWPVVWVMEKTCTLWLLILSWYKHWWLIGFCVPHPLVLGIPVVCTLAIMHYKYYVHPWQRILYMSIVIIGYCLALKMYQYMHEPLITSIPCNGSALTIISTHDKTICIDNGCMAKKRPNIAWIEYELLPTITKKTGKTHITHFVCLKSSIRSLEIVKLLNKNSPLTLVIIPVIHSSNTEQYALALQEIKNILSPHSLVLIDKQNRFELVINDQLRILIKNLNQEVSSQKKTFLSLQIYDSLNCIRLESKALKNP